MHRLTEKEEQKRNRGIWVGVVGLVVWMLTLCMPIKVMAAEEDAIIAAETTEDAACQLKQAIKGHKERVRFGFSNVLTGEQIREIYQKACAHDVNDPTGGDYLDLQIKAITFPNGYITIANSRYVYLYEMTYYHTKEQEDTVEASIQNMLDGLGIAGKTEREKARLIYDYLRENIQYDFSGSTGDFRYTAYGALQNQKAVCSGYASLLYRACLMAGLDARIVKGRLTNGDNHVWNLVKVDGDYYAVDVTLDAANHTNQHFLDCDMRFSDLRPKYQYLPQNSFSYPMSHRLKKRVVQPTIKANGKITTYCEKCGRTTTETVTYYPPKGTSIKKVSAGKKKCTVTIKRQTFLTAGYEIQYSRSSAFKNAKIVRVKGNKTTKKTIKGLTSKKKYYVRVRTYRNVGTTRCYSAWSSRKKVKIR